MKLEVYLACFAKLDVFVGHQWVMYLLERQVSPCSSLSIMSWFSAWNALLVGASTVSWPSSRSAGFSPTRPITGTRNKSESTFLLKPYVSYIAEA